MCTKTYILILLILFIGLVHCEKTDYCKKEEDLVTICVEDPILSKDDLQWCPYHVCAPSFQASDECPEFGKPGTPATHKCSKVTERRELYKCRQRRPHRMIKVPVGCEGDACTGERRSCSCRLRNRKRTTYTPLFTVTPLCPSEAP